MPAPLGGSFQLPLAPSLQLQTNILHVSGTKAVEISFHRRRKNSETHASELGSQEAAGWALDVRENSTRQE
jgi:hypothetical protein